MAKKMEERFIPQIDNDTNISVLMEAHLIPDGSIVAKRTGYSTHVIRQKLKVYQDTKGEKPMEIEGTFLVDERGNINKIKPDTILAWTMRAESFYDWLVDQQIGDNYIEDK
jgi:hypothetical protein